MNKKEDKMLEIRYVVKEDKTFWYQLDKHLPEQEFEEDSETSAEPSQENIEGKLIKLESLYHQGLITQEEYDSKRKEILDRL